jgi:hypothetical protein
VSDEVAAQIDSICVSLARTNAVLGDDTQFVTRKRCSALSDPCCRRVVRRFADDGTCRLRAVSTMEQGLDAQLDTLSAAGVDPGASVHRHTVWLSRSGAAWTDRDDDYAWPGHAVVVAAIDRLGRSVAEVTRTMAELDSRRITLRASRQGCRYGSPTGRVVAAIMATFAELQLELDRERRAANRESRRARSAGRRR